MKYKLIKQNKTFETDNWRIADTMWAQGWKFSNAKPVEEKVIAPKENISKKKVKQNG